VIAAPLTGPIPLRDSVILDAYGEARRLPHGYGKMTVRPIRYDDTGRAWLVFDHAAGPLVSVTRDDEPYAAAELINRPDSQGHTVALLETADNISDDDALVVTVHGKRHPDSGAPVINPADVLWDILANICRQPITETDLTDFRIACATAGLAVAGVLGEGSALSARASIDQIMTSIGAVWSDAMPGIARLYPVESLGSESVGTITPMAMAESAASGCGLSAIATHLTLRYDYDHAEGDYRRSITVRAPEAIERYGDGIPPRIIDAAWLPDERSAADVATRLLQYYARPVWRTSIDLVADAQLGGSLDIGELTAGLVLDLQDPAAAVTGPQLIADCLLEEPDGSTGAAIALEGHNTPAPAVEIAQRSSRVVGKSGETFARYRDGVAEIVALDDAGLPIPQALVSVGSMSKTADANGIARFVGIDPGLYRVRIVAPDGREITADTYRIGL